MGTIFKVTDNNHNHSHIVLINEDTGEVTVSTEDGHTHYPELINNISMGQKPIILNGAPMSIMFDPDIEKHSHTLLDPVYNKIKWYEDDIQEMKDQIERYKDADEIETDSIEKGIEAEKFVVGDQWDEDVKNIRNKSGKPSLTINVIQPMMDTLMGMFLQNETDFKAFPSEEGDELIASVITRLLKFITNKTKLQYQSKKVFSDGITAGRGCFLPFIDYSDNIKGDIKIKWHDWKNFRFGPHKEEDLSDCKYGIIQKWVTAGEAKDYYDLKDEDLGIIDVTTTSNKMIEDVGGLDPNGAVVTNNNNEGEPGLNYMLKDNNKYLVLERRERVIKKIPIAVLDNDIIELQNYRKYVKQFKNMEGVKVVDKTIERVKIIVSVGNTIVSKDLLSDSFSDLFIVPFYAYKFVIDNKNVFYGKVQQAKDPQAEINLRHCQMSQAANGSSNKFFYDDSTFVNDNDRQKFIRTAHKQNGVYRVNDVNRPPKSEVGAPIPTGSAQMLETDLKLFRQITNVNPEIQGTQQGTQSGVAIMQKKQSAFMGNEIIFSNFNEAKVRLGNLIVKLMQDVYVNDPDRIIRILENDYSKGKFELPMNGQPTDFKQVPINYILEKLKDVDMLKYDISIDLNQASQSSLMARYLMLSELQRNGIPIPPAMIIKSLPISGKEEILMAMQQQPQIPMQPQQGQKPPQPQNNPQNM